MRRANHGLTLIAVAFLTACDADSSRPVLTQPSPTPPVVSPIPPTVHWPVHGQIAIASITPTSGAIVPVRMCEPGSQRFCADQPQLTIDVAVDQDIANASLTVSFGRCAFGRTPGFSLAAHIRRSLTISVLDLSDDGPLHDGVGAKLFCPLPAETGHIIVNLWHPEEPRTPALTSEFANTYTFAMP